MGKEKSKLPKGSFSLKASPNAQGEEPVYLKYYVQGKYAKRSTNIWVLPKDWDSKLQKVKSSNKSYARLNANLANTKRKVDDQIVAFDEGVITWQVVQEMLDGKYLPENERAKNSQFVGYCNKVNETLYGREDYGYSVFYNNELHIKKFEKFLTQNSKTDISLADVNRSLLDGFVLFLRDNNPSIKNVSINKCLTPLKNAIQYAIDNGELTATKGRPLIEGLYLEVKTRTYDPDAEEEEGKVKYLTEEQLKSFIEYKPRSIRASATKDIMDIFLFSYYSCGLRVSDIVTLEWNNIDFETQRLTKIQVKTKQKMKISPKLPEQAMSILNKWKVRNLNKRFVFNYLPEEHVFSKDTQHALKMRINAVDRTINISLNKIGRNLNFPFPLTIHVARHTFCVMALSHGMSLHVVSQLMGHSSILSTEKTYAEYLDKAVDDEMDKLSILYEEGENE